MHASPTVIASGPTHLPLPLWLQVVERLYRLKWSSKDGLGSLVLTPTRELALQIFDELKKVGHRSHTPSGPAQLTSHHCCQHIQAVWEADHP